MERYISKSKVLKEYKKIICAEWVSLGNSGTYKCSNCAHKSSKTNFCPHCGAEMSASTKVTKRATKKKNKAYYAIKKGRENNIIVNTWEECKTLVTGYPGAEYKKFNMKKEAKEWLKN